MKYIDGEKLKEIMLPSYEEAKKESLSATDAVKWEKVEYIFDFVFHLIDSLQQEPTPDTHVLHTELVNLLKTYRIGEETARTMADRIADTYGAQRYMDGLCDGLDEEDTKQEQPEHYKKDESLGSPDYERGFKHGRDYQTSVERKYTNKDKVIAYLADKGYPVSTNGEIPTYQETFDMINNAVKHANKQEQPEVDLVAELKHHLDTTPKEQLEKEWKELEPWCNVGPTVQEFLYGKQPEVDLEKEIQEYIQKLGFGYGGWVDGLSDEDLKNIARYFYELGLKAK